MNEAELSYVPVESQKSNDALNDVWQVELATFGCDAQTRQAMMNKFMYLVRGMAFQSQWRRNPEHFKNMLENWLFGAEFTLTPKNTCG